MGGSGSKERSQSVSQKKIKKSTSSTSSLPPNIEIHDDQGQMAAVGEKPSDLTSTDTSYFTSQGDPQQGNGASKPSMTSRPSDVSINTVSSPVDAVPASPPKEENKGVGFEQKVVANSVTSRLQVKTNFVVQEESILESKKGTKLFDHKEEKDSRSKIFKALNPDKLAFESRREKEEKQENKVHLSLGGPMRARLADDDDDDADDGYRDYAVMRDAEGNIVTPEEEEDDDDDFDPDNLPDFGEFKEEIAKLRAERARMHEEKQAKYREEYLRKKAEEQKLIDEELRRIQERAAREEKSKISNSDTFVADAQARLEREATFGQFKWAS